MIAIQKQPFETDANKALFAEELLRNPTNAYKAAKVVFPRDTAIALFVSNNWVVDEYVLAKQKEFIKEGGEAKYLPTKSQVARQIHNVSAEVNDADLELKALRLYCDVRGYIEKPGTVVNNQITSVMLVKDHGTDEDWEKRMLEQQKTLIESSA